MPAIVRIGYVLEGTPENLESKAKAVKCNFDFDHDDIEELSHGLTTDPEFAVLSRRLQYPWH